MSMQVLEPLSEAIKRIPEGARPCHTTAWRWGQQYPGLVAVIAGRMYGRPACWDAIGRGMSLAEASMLGGDDGRAAA